MIKVTASIMSRNRNAEVVDTISVIMLPVKAVALVCSVMPSSPRSVGGNIVASSLYSCVVSSSSVVSGLVTSVVVDATAVVGTPVVVGACKGRT